MDVDVQEINDGGQIHEEKWWDVEQFFHPAVVKLVNGKQKSTVLASFARELPAFSIFVHI